MRIVKQLSVFLINQPGRLAAVASALAKEKINITALTLMDSTEHGVLRVVAEEPERAKKVLERIDCPVTETEVLCVELPNRPGAFASVAQELGSAHINIDYAYVTAGAPGGKTLGIFKVPFLQKAAEVLESRLRRKGDRATEASSPRYRTAHR